MVCQVSNTTPERLEMEYREAVANGVFSDGGDLCPVDGEFDMDEADAPEGLEGVQSENPCFDLLQQIKSSTVDMLDPEKNQDEGLESAEAVACSDGPKEGDLDGVPDQEQIEKLTTATSSLRPFRSELYGSPGNKADDDYMPKTLAEALSLKGNFFNKVFRFAVQLRAGPGGCDSGFVKNPLLCRKSSKKLNWCQILGGKWLRVADRDQYGSIMINMDQQCVNTTCWSKMWILQNEGFNHHCTFLTRRMVWLSNGF